MAFSRKPIRNLFAACVILAAMVTRASADDAVTVEPDRLAFVVGQSLYTTNASPDYTAGDAMPDLLTACSEAMEFRRLLIAMGWSRDRIYPLVTAAAGQETDAEVRTAICDLSKDELEDALGGFTRTVLRHQAPVFSVVYISGHGVESNGRQYIFGVDARIDLDEELRIAAQAPGYRMFRNVGVNVLDHVADINQAPGRAVLVILDACRDNPVLEPFVGRTWGSGPNLISIDYITSARAFDAYDRTFRNILVLFSTRAGETAAGASPGGSTEFSQLLRTVVSDPTFHPLSPSDVVDEIRERAFMAQRHLPDSRRQIPQRVGLIRPRPVFCFWGCPQPAGVWSSDRTEIITEAPRAAREAANRRRELRPANFSPQRPASLIFASLSDQSPETPAASTERRATTELDLRVDVFYCIDDDRAQEREASARAYAQTLRSELPTDFILASRSLGTVRLRSLSANLNNRTGYRRADNSIWIDPADTVEATWAQRMSAIDGRALPYRATRTAATPGYISVFFCEGADPDRTVDQIYTVIPADGDLEQAQRLVDQLQGRLPDARFVRVARMTTPTVTEALVEPARPLEETEIRYYFDQQTRNAEALARELSTVLGRTVVARRRPLSIFQYTTQMLIRGNSAIDLRIAAEDMPVPPEASAAAPDGG